VTGRRAPGAVTIFALVLLALPAATGARSGLRAGEGARAPAAAPALAAAPAPGDAEVYQVALSAAERDYFLPSPVGRSVWLALDARRAAPKSRVMFQGAIAGGPLRLHIDVRHGSPAQSFVVAVPLGPGRSEVVVSITGRGRFDLGFFADGPGAAPGEYRFTRRAPLDPTPFAVRIPARDR
jgi:hypothetical protein